MTIIILSYYISYTISYQILYNVKINFIKFCTVRPITLGLIPSYVPNGPQVTSIYTRSPYFTIVYFFSIVDRKTLNSSKMERSTKTRYNNIKTYKLNKEHKKSS